MQEVAPDANDQHHDSRRQPQERVFFAQAAAAHQFQNHQQGHQRGADGKDNRAVNHILPPRQLNRQLKM